MPEKRTDHTTEEEEPLFTRPAKETLVDLVKEAAKPAFFSDKTRAGLAVPQDEEGFDIYTALEKEATGEE